MTSEAHNTPVSTPSGPSAGLEGQDATQEVRDATEAAQRRRERYAEAMRLAGARAAGQEAAVARVIAVADREQADLDAAWKEFHDMAVAGYEDDLAELRAEVERLRKPTVAAVMGYELGAGDLERAEARVAELEAIVAEVRAEVEHWKDHAEEAGQGFTRFCKDYARTAARNSDLLRRIQTALARSRQTSGQTAWTLAQLQNDLDAMLDAPKDTTAP